MTAIITATIIWFAQDLNHSTIFPYLYNNVAFDILITIVSPIIRTTVMQNTIANSVLKVSAILPIKFTILVSAIGSHIADVKL